MPHIELRKVSKYICRDVDLEIEDGQLMVLLGPSGAGKTTLLNSIAGLIDYEGTILFDGRPMDGVPPSSRGIGYVLQGLALFPHLDVAGNVGFSLGAKKWPKDRIDSRVKSLLSLMRIEHLARRYPKNLSGGEKQRVALARALAPSPAVLLLDEPLNSLDLQTAKFLRGELRQLQRNLRITMVYVTHNLEEAEEMADRIAVIQNGCVEQAGAPDEVFYSPESEAVSDLIGSPNILCCQSYRSLDHGVIEAHCGELSIIAPHEGNGVRKVAILPRDVYVSATKPPGPAVNRFKGVIRGIRVEGSAVRLDTMVGSTSLVAEMPYHLFEESDLKVGSEVFLILKLRRLKIYEPG